MFNKAANSIRTIRPDAQLYTLVCTDNETNQQCINTYNGNPILTTELEELVIYTATLIHHYGKAFTYTISMVHGMPVAEHNAHMLAQLEKLTSKQRLKATNAVAYPDTWSDADFGSHPE